MVQRDPFPVATPARSWIAPVGVIHLLMDILGMEGTWMLSVYFQCIPKYPVSQLAPKRLHSDDKSITKGELSEQLWDEGMMTKPKRTALTAPCKSCIGLTDTWTD